MIRRPALAVCGAARRSSGTSPSEWPCSPRRPRSAFGWPQASLGLRGGTLLNVAAPLRGNELRSASPGAKASLRSTPNAPTVLLIAARNSLPARALSVSRGRDIRAVNRGVRRVSSDACACLIHDAAGVEFRAPLRRSRNAATAWSRTIPMPDALPRSARTTSLRALRKGLPSEVVTSNSG